ncbi:MAG TPA: laccase domain-containing protein, partial [Gaiellaceae bacterium]|nr:laccase domain-containing protein [Gaiellaceae bacterium]
MSDVEVVDWQAPGPYRVAFSTRLGGVSEGAFASLNLGILTEDNPASVVENRTRLCDAVGADPDGATMAWQRHGSTVTRAQPRGIVTPGTVYDHCDGLWSDEPGRAMLLLTADCIPIAIARGGGDAPAVGILHAGWRGLLAGLVG